MFRKGKKQNKDVISKIMRKDPEKVNIDDIKEKNKEVNNKAKEYLKDKDKLQKLIKEAEEKVEEQEEKKGFVKETWDNLQAMFELVKSYIKGDYKNIPYGSLVLIVGAILYFVMPADAIPDFIAVLGFTDDATVIAFTLKKVKDDIDKFIAWKNEQEVKEN
jgi:uncharacterized membrane protein YkvA (DUF1232 family)